MTKKELIDEISEVFEDLEKENASLELLIKEEIPMKTYHITCEEINTFTVEVEADNEDQAFELVKETINKYPVINESVSEWCVDDIAEVTQ